MPRTRPSEMLKTHRWILQVRNVSLRQIYSTQKKASVVVEMFWTHFCFPQWNQNKCSAFSSGKYCERVKTKNKKTLPSPATFSKKKHFYLSIHWSVCLPACLPSPFSLTGISSSSISNHFLWMNQLKTQVDYAIGGNLETHLFIACLWNG